MAMKSILETLSLNQSSNNITNIIATNPVTPMVTHSPTRPSTTAHSRSGLIDVSLPKNLSLGSMDPTLHRSNFLMQSLNAPLSPSIQNTMTKANSFYLEPSFDLSQNAVNNLALINKSYQLIYGATFSGLQVSGIRSVSGPESDTILSL
jgi:hypothetical protein